MAPAAGHIMPANFPHKAVKKLEDRIKLYQDKLATHPLYKAVQNVEQLRLFMENHVFAVWDFMSLLKSLQLALTCVEIPWTVKGYRESRRLINEIVLGEESDFVAGQNISHLELYLDSMTDAGANTKLIQKVLRDVSDSKDITDESISKAFVGAGAPKPAELFVRKTFEFIRTGKLHVIASAFTFGREDLIPIMFTGLLKDMNKDMDGALNTFIVYLERHIEVDGEDHGPMSLEMMAEVCGDDNDKRWEEATVAAEKALQARIELWDGVVEELQLIK